VGLRFLAALGVLVLNILLCWGIFSLIFWIINTLLSGSPLGSFLNSFGSLSYIVLSFLFASCLIEGLWQLTIRYVIRLKEPFGKKTITLAKSERDRAFEEIVNAVTAAQKSRNDRGT